MKKIIIAVLLVAFSNNGFSMSGSDVEPTPTPEPSELSTQSLLSPEEVRQQEYQKILGQIAGIKETNPDNDNPEVGVLIFPIEQMDSLQFYDMLTSIIRDMPEGSLNNFTYRNGSKFASAEVNKVGVEYLHSLNMVHLGLNSVEAQ